jgi:hypothetical protein
VFTARYGLNWQRKFRLLSAAVILQWGVCCWGRYIYHAIRYIYRAIRYICRAIRYICRAIRYIYRAINYPHINLFIASIFVS